MLRVLGAAAVLLAWRRPAAGGVARPRGSLRAAAFGLATARMNIAFYEAIARLPLGTAVAIEFCGPVAVAAVASRRPRDVAAVVLAAVGVALIADVRWSGQPSGVAVGARGGRRCGRPTSCWASGWRGAGNGLDDMAVGFAVAAVVLSPLLLLGGAAGRAALADPVGAAARGRGRGAVQRGALRAGPGRAAPGRAGAASRCCWRCCRPPRRSSGWSRWGRCPSLLEAVGIAAVVVAVAVRSRDGDAPGRRPTDREHGTECSHA